MKAKYITIRQTKYVLENYDQMTNREIAARTGLTTDQVRCAYLRAGFRKPQPFVKGQRPWNKGLKGVMHGGEVTQFKKGHLPHNTKHDGAIVTRHEKDGKTRKYIRTALAKWEPLHRVIWENEFGKVPKGHIIIFDNKDTNDFRLENLVCVKRGEHLKRNQTKADRSRNGRKAWQTRLKRGTTWSKSVRIKLKVA